MVMLQLKFPFNLSNVSFCMSGRFYSIKSFKKLNYYTILNVQPTASRKEIRKAYLEKSKLLHPDATSSNAKDTHEEFVLINEAYSVLIKPDKRREYDALLKQKGMYSQSSFHNPHRSANYKSPYKGFNDRRHSNPMWTDYYTPNARKRAKYNMEQDVNSSFWQDHWKFSRKFGGGGPNMASHDQSPMKEMYYKSKDAYFLFGTIAILVIISILPILFSKGLNYQVEHINQQYHMWLVKNIKNNEYNFPSNLDSDQKKK